MDPQPGIVDLVEVVQFNWTGTLAFAAITSITIYDYLLTFQDEVDYVWRQKFTGATAIFLLNRYLLLANITISSIPVASWTNISCGVLSITCLILSMLNQIVLAVFAVMRIYAIWNHGLKFAFILLVLYAVPIISTLVYIATSKGYRPMVFGLGCIDITPSHHLEQWEILVDVFNITSSCATVVLTWAKTISLKREALALRMHVPYTTLLLRDGSLQFLVIFLLNVSNIVLASSMGISLNQVINLMLSSILVTHFFIHLRQVHLLQDDDNTSYRSSALHFASNIVGNLGAPLYNMFTDDIEEISISSRSSPQMSNNPLAYGLPFCEEPEEEEGLLIQKNLKKSTDMEILFDDEIYGQRLLQVIRKQGTAETILSQVQAENKRHVNEDEDVNENENAEKIPLTESSY